MNSSITKVLSVEDIEAEPRVLPDEFVSLKGEPRFARSAVVRTAAGDTVKVSVIGTAKQWQYFDGRTIEARFVDSTSRPGERVWKFSPAVGETRITDANAF